MFSGIFLAILLYLTPAFATEKPAEIAPYIHANAPYGQATLTKLMLKVYDGSLWTDASPWSMDKPFALTLRYNMHFTARDLADRSIDEIKRSQNLTDEQSADYHAQLMHLFPDVHKGDTITALYLPAKGAWLFYNGNAMGKIVDPVFARQFLGIWLSEQTSEPEFRNALLGAKRD